ncbi:response regulator transcription factor [Crocosphaera sp. Alani8]|uniref:response regulator transcription factor n=1 Tax=Crocosphaera sp. Alani8 TaxID=3038952 RepID=UPI00313E4640
MSHILLVEDSRVEAEKLTRYLQKQGLSVLGVTSGEEAELRLKQEKPRLIVLDVILPGESGFELCRKLKADPLTQQIPVVICSIKNKEIDKTWGRMSGADAYLTKPLNKEVFQQTINQLIG